MKIEKINIDGKKDTIEVLDQIFSSKISHKTISNVLYKLKVEKQKPSKKMR